MHGSGESHMAYFYKRINTPAQPSSSSFKIKIPRRRNFPNEKDEEVLSSSLSLYHNIIIILLSFF